jgi:molybdopterin-guanine dinucleotide biosynthesis protein MobB
VDFILVEGFKSHPFPKIEVHRSALGTPPIWPAQPDIVAIAAEAWLEADRPVLPPNNPCAIAAWPSNEHRPSRADVHEDGIWRLDRALACGL